LTVKPISQSEVEEWLNVKRRSSVFHL
jgi:hypothetical protein